MIRLHKLVVDAVACQAIRAHSARTGSISTNSATPADFVTFVKSETATWQRIVTDAGIAPECTPDNFPGSRRLRELDI